MKWVVLVGLLLAGCTTEGGPGDGLAPTEDHAPAIGFARDSAQRTVMVTTIDHDGVLRWGDFDVKGCIVPYGAASRVNAGDGLRDCGGRVTITHKDTNTLVYETALPAPHISFSKDSAGGRLTVVSVETGLSWGDLSVQGCWGVPSGPVAAGDSLTECDGAVQVTHVPTDTRLYDTRFDSPPQMGFTTSQADDSIRVSTAPPGRTWDRFNVSANETSANRIDFALNGDPDGMPPDYPADVGTGPVTAGDTIHFCAVTENATQVSVTIVHKGTNTVTYATTLMDIAPC